MTKHPFHPAPARKASLDGVPPGPAGAPREVAFNVVSARALAALWRARHPGLRTTRRRSWHCDPETTTDGAGPRLAQWALATLLPRSTAATPLWYWEGSEDDLAAQAATVLLQFVHPLAAGESSYCLGFPFGPDVLAPRSLSINQREKLDLEDIGALLDYAQARPCRRPARHAAQRPDSPAALHETLDERQIAAVEHGRGAARVLAPAGSGKTKTLISRVVELVARGVHPAQILLLAFNTKAAEQLEERLAQRGIATTRTIGLDESRPAVHCATFNAFAARYQREVMCRRCTVDTGGLLSRATMRAALAEGGYAQAAGGRHDDDSANACLAALPRVRAALEAPESLAVELPGHGDGGGSAASFAGLHAVYTRLQQTRGHQSFDDQIYFAVRDLLEHPERRRSVQAKYAFVLVDEYQDLNGAQLALVDIISRPRRNLYVVGDDDQLIYGWRFADPAGILDFHDRVPPPPLSHTYRLATNYRCSRAVVTAAARLIANNQRREAKDVAPRPNAPHGALHFVAAPLWSDRAAAMCAFLRAEQARLGCAWRELAVLSRYRSQQLAVALALDAHGIPRTARLEHYLFAHPTARVVRACIEVGRAPEEARGPDLRRVIDALARPGPSASGTAAGESWADVVRMASQEDAHGDQPAAAVVALAETLHAEFGPSLRAAPALSRGGAASRARASVSAENQHDSARLLTAVVRGLKLLHGRSLASAPPDETGPRQALDGLALLAETYPRPSDYIAAWDRLAATESAGPNTGATPRHRAQPAPDTVEIGTLHAAKGREYLSVVIPDYDCDVTCWSRAAIEEERRVVYVGVTRAAESVLFTINPTRPYVHPFLRELVAPPEPEEHAGLLAQLAHVTDPEVRAKLAGRLQEIEVLFPETVDPQSEDGDPRALAHR